MSGRVSAWKSECMRARARHGGSVSARAALLWRGRSSSHPSSNRASTRANDSPVTTSGARLDTATAHDQEGLAYSRSTLLPKTRTLTASINLSTN